MILGTGDRASLLSEATERRRALCEWNTSQARQAQLRTTLRGELNRLQEIILHSGMQDEMTGTIAFWSHRFIETLNLTEGSERIDIDAIYRNFAASLQDILRDSDQGEPLDINAFIDCNEKVYSKSLLDVYDLTDSVLDSVPDRTPHLVARSAARWLDARGDLPHSSVLEEVLFELRDRKITTLFAAAYCDEEVEERRQEILERQALLDSQERNTRRGDRQAFAGWVAETLGGFTEVERKLAALEQQSSVQVAESAAALASIDEERQKVMADRQADVDEEREFHVNLRRDIEANVKQAFQPLNLNIGQLVQYLQAGCTVWEETREQAIAAVQAKLKSTRSEITRLQDSLTRCQKQQKENQEALNQLEQMQSSVDQKILETKIATARLQEKREDNTLGNLLVSGACLIASWVIKTQLLPGLPFNINILSKPSVPSAPPI